ncbi:Sucrase/ferredoxin-like-domain-containing protein [Leucosporidium creatinivorum]|uniref:Sucrase/ferredoxin-like-domain-containing protein n=1 Tax=Leucosporidium creatinivorum TaxID=106004 RepID=A0A1Y2G024_9BASI|nr:Sucrase/ferredoxin-like-domain-containing protein [Leucosporidium creatinivorum]
MVASLAQRTLHATAARTSLRIARPCSRALSTPSSSSLPPLVGTAPEYKRHLILHVNQEAKDWPSHLDSTSKLYKELGERFGKHPVLSKSGFGVSDAGTRQQGEKPEKWDSSRPRFEEPVEGKEQESYTATLYPDFIPVPPLSLSTLSSFEDFFLALPSPSALSPPPSSTPPRADIYVCTHGARDCRCADLGEPLYQALVKEAKRRRLGGEMGDPEAQEGVRIARVAHIGGHKWAGNALMYRQDGRSDWYGLLRAEDAGELLDHAIATDSKPWWSRWRGRLGMSSEEVKDAYLEGTIGGSATRKRKEKARNALGDPVQLIFKSWDNVEEYKVMGYEGETVMETAKRHDLPSILATCGGHCECATCHVHIAPIEPPALQPSDSGRPLAAIPQEAPAPEMTDEEDEQLEFAMGADDNSRLGCQIPVTKDLGEWIAGGGRIQLPRY